MVIETSPDDLVINRIEGRNLPAAAVPQNLPPALAETIPNLPAFKENRSFAVICSEFACQPPIFEAAELTRQLHATSRPAA